MEADSICTSVNSVVNTTNLVGHWVAHTKEGIGEAIPAIVDALCIFSRASGSAVLTDFSNHSKTSLIVWRGDTVCIVVSKVWSVGFSRVCQDVHTCVSSNKIWNWFNQSRVNNGNSWCQWVVSQWVFAVVFLIRDNSKWCYFWTCTWSRWDTDVLAFLPSDGKRKARLRISMNFWTKSRKSISGCS